MDSSIESSFKVNPILTVGLYMNNNNNSQVDNNNKDETKKISSLSYNVSLIYYLYIQVSVIYTGESNEEDTGDGGQ